MNTPAGYPGTAEAPDVEAPQAQPTSWRDYVLAGQLSEALARHLDTSPEDAETTRLLDSLIALRGHLRAKSWSQAERVAATVAPELATVTPNLAEQVGLLRESGERLERADVDAALPLLERVDLQLLQAEAQTQRGTALVFMDDPVAAERAFRRATELDPKHYRALTNLGNVALEAGRVDEAITHYEAALKLNENFSNAHHNLGVAYRRKGQVHKSVKAIRKAQRVGRHRDQAEAKNAVRALTQGQRGKYLKWLVWAVVAVGGYLLLQSLQII